MLRPLKPWIHLAEATDGDSAADRLVDFIAQHSIKVLNVAGPRASKEPRVAEFVTRILGKVLT